MCNNIICGGFSKNPDIGIDNSCVKWDEKTAEFHKMAVTLKKPRDNIVCWGLQSGDVILFGGADLCHGNADAERVHKSGTSSETAFPLVKNHNCIK